MNLVFPILFMWLPALGTTFKIMKATFYKHNQTHVQFDFKLQEATNDVDTMELKMDHKTIGTLGRLPKDQTNGVYTILAFLDSCQEQKGLYLSYRANKVQQAPTEKTSETFSYDLEACGTNKQSPNPETAVGSHWAIIGPIALVVLVLTLAVVGGVVYLKKRRKVEQQSDRQDKNPMYGVYSEAGGEAEVIDQNFYYSSTG
jgi:hypothetical protein